MNEATHKRTVDAIEQVKAKLQSSAYVAPEFLGRLLWSVYIDLSNHYGESNARADIPHVGAILRSIARRRETEPGFSAALDDYLASEPDNEAPVVPIASPKEGPT